MAKQIMNDRVRAISIKANEMAAEEDDAGPKELSRAAALRPQKRGDCVDGPRPCPWAGCRHNLQLDVSAAGTIKINFPDLAEMGASCALDVASRGGLGLVELGRMMNLTKERVRQIESRGLVKMGLTGVRLLG